MSNGGKSPLSNYPKEYPDIVPIDFPTEPESLVDTSLKHYKRLLQDYINQSIKFTQTSKYEGWSSGNKSLDSEIIALAKYIDSQRKPIEVKNLVYHYLFEEVKYKGKSIIDLGKISLITFSEYLYPGVELLKENQKQSLFKKNATATMAILLYEFASGEGSEKRTFTIIDPITHTIINSPAFIEALSNFFKENEQYNVQQRTDIFRPKKKINAVEGFFAFSPDETKITISLVYHAEAYRKIKKSQDWSGLYFGGLHYRISPNNEGGLNVVFIDEKTRNSFFAHLLPDISRESGMPFGSTYQAYTFIIPSTFIQQLYKITKMLTKML